MVLAFTWAFALREELPGTTLHWGPARMVMWRY